MKATGTAAQGKHKERKKPPLLVNGNIGKSLIKAVEQTVLNTSSLGLPAHKHPAEEG